MLYIKEIYDRRGKIIFSILLILVLILVLAFTKDYTISILKKLNTQELNKLPFSSTYINPVIQKLEADFDFYFYSQWLGKNFIQFMFLFAIMFSFSIFSKEKENKTFYYLLSIFPRKKIYHTKVLVSYLSFALITIIGVISVYIPYLIFKKPAPINYILYIPTVLLFFSYLFFVETIISILSQNSLTPVIFGLIITILIIFFEATGISNIKLLTYILNPLILYSGYFPWVFVILSLIINSILYFIGYYIFKKIDF